LAIAIGTSHGAYKFTRPPTGDILAIDRIKEIHARIPNTHLVMHGSSSVPQEWLAIINEYGGDIKETYGVPVEEIVEAIKHGVRKVNIDTDLRSGLHRRHPPFHGGRTRRIRPAQIPAAKTVTAMRDICIAATKPLARPATPARSSRSRWKKCRTNTPRGSWRNW
jgi:fructose-bisphosphate aldolase class II